MTDKESLRRIAALARKWQSEHEWVVVFRLMSEARSYREQSAKCWGYVRLRDERRMNPDPEDIAQAEQLDAAAALRQAEIDSAWRELAELENLVREHLPAVLPDCPNVMSAWPEQVSVEALNGLRRVEAAALGAATGLNPEKPPQKTPKRPRQRKVKNLTARQAEIVHVVGECQGNIAEAARKLERDYKTVRKAYDAAMEKLGSKAIKHKTQALPTDRRGNANI